MPPNGEHVGLNTPKSVPQLPSQRIPLLPGARNIPLDVKLRLERIADPNRIEDDEGAMPNKDFLREIPKTSLEKNRPLRPDEATGLYSLQKKAAIEGRSEAARENERKAAAMKADLRGEFGAEIPNLEQKIRDFDAQIRDLRVQRKATDTWFMKTFSNGKQRLEQIDASEKRIIAERDGLRDRMEAILHPEGPKGRKDVIQQARDNVVLAVAEGKAEREKVLSGKDLLRMQRGKLEEQLAQLPKWPASMLPWNSMAKDRILDALEKNATSMQEFINAEHFRAQEAAFRKQTEQR